MDGRAETQVKQYICQFHSIHLADIKILALGRTRTESQLTPAAPSSFFSQLTPGVSVYVCVRRGRMFCWWQ